MGFSHLCLAPIFAPAANGDVFLADDFERAISTLQGRYKWREFCILNIRERLVVGAFELDAD